MGLTVPFRDREEHLRTFLLHMHSFLPRQQVDYGIFIVEQVGNGSFNRAMLFNVGVAEALKSYDFQCFIFHDVDLLPEDARNLYTCPVQPRHMSVAVNTFSYKLLYKGGKTFQPRNFQPKTFQPGSSSKTGFPKNLENYNFPLLRTSRQEQKYSRLRCLLCVKGLVICFYLG